MGGGIERIVGTEKEIEVGWTLKANYPFGKLGGRVVICLYGYLVLLYSGGKRPDRGKTGA